MSKYSIKELRANIAPEDLAVLDKMYFDVSHFSLLFSFSNMMGFGFANAVHRMIDHIYKDEPEDVRKSAISRQGEFWNCDNVLSVFAVGILCSMEKDHVQTGNTSVEAIQSVKASLIGPLSAIGDTIFWVVWRILVTGVALTFSLQGSVVGPILFIVGYNLPKFILRYYLLYLGYGAGKGLLDSMGKSGLMQQLTAASNILGVFMLGGMVAMMVNVPITAVYSVNGLEQSIAGIFDSIMPGLLSVALVFVMHALVKKKIAPALIVLGTFVVGILGALIGLF